MDTDDISEYISKNLNVATAKYASGTYERIIELIQDFEENIKEDEQASMIVPAFPNNPILVNDLRYYNPYIIIFEGTFSDGSYVEVLQHQSQLNLCLIASKRLNPKIPRRKIWFSLDSQED